MNVTTDTKAVIGIFLSTILIIGGAAFLASRKAPQGSVGDNQATPVAQPELLTRKTESNSLGPSSALVTVVEFADFECPACATLNTIMKDVRRHYADKPVRFEYRHFVLAQHKNSYLAALASEAAAEQGRFWDYIDVLYENQETLSRADLERYAKEIGLDVEAFKQALDENAHSDAVQQDRTDALALGLNSTPTLFISNMQYNGPLSQEAILDAIEKELNSVGGN